MFDVAAQGAQEVGAFGAIDDAVIAGERDAHALAHDDLSVNHDRLGHDGADGQATGLGWVEDRRELVDTVHAQVGDGEGAALALGGPGLVTEQRFDRLGALDVTGWTVKKGEPLFPKERKPA